MRDRIINVSGWIGLVLWILGLVLVVFHIPGAALAFVFATFTTQFIFIPLFFFVNDKRLEKHYSISWLRIIQGVALFIIGFSSVFIVLHWPFSTVLSYASFVCMAILAVTLIFTSTPYFQHPHRIALIIIILLNPIVLKITNHITDNQSLESMEPNYHSVVQQRQMLKKEYEAIQRDSSFEEQKSADSLLNLIRDIEVTLYKNGENISGLRADSLLKQGIFPKSGSNYEIPTHLLIGPDVNKPKPATDHISALHLKNLWESFAKPKLQSYPDSLSRMSSFSFDGYTWAGWTKSWVNSEFHHVPLGIVLTRLELYKVFIYNDLVIQSLIHKEFPGELLAVKRNNTLRTFNGELQNALATYEQSDENRTAFMAMMVMACVLTTLLFFIPILSLSKNWKLRLILFALVVIFEFVLLLTDYSIGMFSQNPIYLLLANIVLALGLVSLDSFLRNNFLSWFESD